MTAAETELVAAPPVVRRLPADPRPRKRNRRIGDRGRLARHRRRQRRHGRRRVRCPARRAALPDQAGRRGGRHRRPRSTTSSKGEALLDQAGHPPRRGARAPGRGLPRPRSGRSHHRVLPERRRRGLGEAVHRLPGRREREDIETVRTFTAQQMADIAAMSAVGGNADRRRSCSTPPTRWPTSTSRRWSCAGRAAPKAALAATRSPQRRRRCGHGRQPARPPGLPGNGRHRRRRGRARSPP